MDDNDIRIISLDHYERICLYDDDVVYWKIDIDASDMDVNMNIYPLLSQKFRLIESNGYNHVSTGAVVILLSQILKIPIDDYHLSIPIFAHIHMMNNVQPISSLECYVDDLQHMYQRYTQSLVISKTDMYIPFLCRCCNVATSKNYITKSSHYVCSPFRYKFLIIYLSNDDIMIAIHINDREYLFFTIEFFNKILYVVSFVKDSFGEYVNDLDTLHEIFQKRVICDVIDINNVRITTNSLRNDNDVMKHFIFV